MEIIKVYAILQGLEKIPNDSILLKAKADTVKKFLENYVESINTGRQVIETHYKEDDQIKPGQQAHYNETVSDFFEMEVNIPFKPFTRKELKGCKLDPQTLQSLIPLIK